MVVIPTAADNERQFTIHAYMGTHLIFDDKYKVVDFDLGYTDGCAGHDHKVAFAQLCVDHYVLIYHYCVAISRFVHSPDYIFGMVDTTNDEKVLKTTGLAYRNLVDIQCEYNILVSEKKHKDSVVDLAMAIVDPYYIGMKDVCKNKKVAWHRAWVRRLDEYHIKYTSKDTYVSYEMSRRIVDMRKCLRRASTNTRRHRKYR
ncbi:hypothetical protein D1007_29761 [Hordeum vulgare]|nr:hypothetical protein D1007_29761 [Hordeum vulgare]